MAGPLAEEVADEEEADESNGLHEGQRYHHDLILHVHTVMQKGLYVILWLA
ncbi:MAG: hypothetical protein ACMG6E_10790 [Candidatus Roizmanbacteria bacterium]